MKQMESGQVEDKENLSSNKSEDREGQLRRQFQRELGNHVLLSEYKESDEN